MITYNIKINPLKDRTSHSNIVLTTGDVKGYKFNFLFEGSSFEYSFITLKAKRADGEIVTAGSDSLEIILPSDMYNVPGDIAFEVAVHDADGGCVTAHVITAFVREGFGDSGIEGDDRYPILTTLINEVEDSKTVFEKLLDENGNLNGDAVSDGSIKETKLDDSTKEKINAQPDWNEQDTSSAAYINNKPDLSKKEDQENKVPSLSSASTNEQYPGAKAVYDFVNNKVSSFATKTVTWTETETETPEKGKMMIVGGLIPKIQVAAETGLVYDYDGMQYAWFDLVTKDNFSGITMPSIHMTADNPDWSGLIQYDGILQKEITMKETLGGKSDKTNIIEGVSGSFLTLLHNTEYRIGTLPSTFEFAFPSSFQNDYISSAIFLTGSTPPVLTYPDGIHWSGDDLMDSVFVPAANKHYTIVFWYDGTYLNGAVRGVEI